MKVVVAHNRYSSGQPSGENIIVDQEIETLRANGVEVIPFLRSSDEIPDLPVAAKAALPLSPVYAGAAQRALRDLLREHRPDVLHLHNPYPLLSPWVIRTAHAAGVPVVQTVHNYRQVCVNGVYYRDGRICTECRGRPVPLPAVAHSCYRGSRAQSLVMASALVLHRATWRSVDRYVALTEAVADHLRGYGIDRARIVVKPNSVPDPGVPAPLGEGFLFLGRLTAEKGIALLLDAWQRHPDGSLGTLRIVGDGPLRELVEKVAGQRADISYAGQAGRDGVRAALAACAVVLAPSTWHDVLPTVVLEALAAGRPVLGSALGGIPYLVGDPVQQPGSPPGGWIVPATVGALAAGLPRARADAAGLAASARQRYLQLFHPDLLTTRLLDVYRGLGVS